MSRLRRRRRAVGLATALLAGMSLTTAPGPAGAAVVGQCGTIARVATPPSLRADASEDTGRLQLMAESAGTTLAAPLVVDLAVPGLYDDDADLPLEPPVVAAGTSVDSYLLHADPVGSPQPGQRYVARLGFDSDILGVIVTGASLAASDALVGATGVKYPLNALERGLELRPTEFVKLTDSHTLELSIRTSTVTDEVRVVTAASASALSATAGAGYRFIGADGGVFTFGDRSYHGSTGGTRLNSPIVGAAATCGGHGYWLVGSDGGIFAFGDAPFLGSTGDIKLNSPIVDMASTHTDAGYWLFAADGGVFNYGDADFKGSLGKVTLNAPIVGGTATPSGDGYWMVASDGGIFTFGDAGFHGSTGAVRLNSPIVAMASTSSGNGYWLVAADGGIFTFGDAVFHGSTGAVRLNSPIVDMVSTATGNGYWLVAADGGVFSFGDAVFLGSTGAIKLGSPIVVAL